MATTRYEVLASIETPECSLRLLRVTQGKSVDMHYHRNTTQIYFTCDGIAQVTVGDTTKTLKPHESIRVPKGVLHSLTSQGEAVVLSVSVPPLQLEDQHPVSH